jgi:hypothetical protein
MDETDEYGGLGRSFFRPLYGATAPIPAGWEDSGWYEFADPITGTKYVVLTPRLAPGDVDAWLEKKRALMPALTTVVSYVHPTLDVRGVMVRPDPDAGPDSLHVLLIVGPFGVRQLMITGRLEQADVQSFVRFIEPERPETSDWVAHGLALPLPKRVSPPSTFEHRSADAVLSIEWTPALPLPRPDLQAFGDEGEVLRTAGPEHYDVSETSQIVERRLVPARLGLGADCFVAQAQLLPDRQPAPWRMATPCLRIGLSGKTRGDLEAVWSRIRANVVFLARETHG